MTARRRRGARPATWIVTMTDLGFLILAFFVVQFAMAVPRPAAWLDLREALSRRMTPTVGAVRTGPTAERGVPLHDEALGLDTDYLEALLANGVLPRLEPFGATLAADRFGVAIALPPPPSGTAWSEGDAAVALAAVAQALRFVENRMAVVAFAEPGPGASGGAMAAFERGLGAAGAIAETLRGAGYGRPIAVRARMAPAGAVAGADGLVGFEIRIDVSKETGPRGP